jgi:hypothetical protein
MYIYAFGPAFTVVVLEKSVVASKRAIACSLFVSRLARLREAPKNVKKNGRAHLVKVSSDRHDLSMQQRA